MENIEVFIGREIKLNLNIEPIVDIQINDYIWECIVYTSPNSQIKIEKSKCIPVPEDNDSYLIPLDTTPLNPGVLKVRVIAHIPDADFEDNYRTEIEVIETNIKLKK